jgi:hypothetical protein
VWAGALTGASAQMFGQPISEKVILMPASSMTSPVRKA